MGTTEVLGTCDVWVSLVTPSSFHRQNKVYPFIEMEVCNLRRFLALKRKKSSAPLKRSTYGSSLMLMPTGEAFSVATSYYHQSRKQGSILRSRLFFWRSQAADYMAALQYCSPQNGMVSTTSPIMTTWKVHEMPLLPLAPILCQHNLAQS